MERAATTASSLEAEQDSGIKVPKKEVRHEKEVEVESSKREGESLKQEIAKKQKMEQDTEELKKRLQIVSDDDDDVYADATPLASKIPIVDYKIHTERNKPYFKIIRADGNHRVEDGSEGVVAVDCGDAGWGGSGCCHGGGRQRLVVVLHVVDLIDRATRSDFGVRRKILPENFSGSGWP
nr:hypothetical protein [Tanacetum cinerariifolium]